MKRISIETEWTYRWQAPAEGQSAYEWLGQPEVLADCEPFAKVLLDLADEPGLFLKLADVPLSREGILEFALQYGFLTGGQSGARYLPDGDTGRKVEFRSSWEEWVSAFRRARTIWELVRDGDVERLGKIVEFKEDGAVLHVDKPLPLVFGSDMPEADWLRSLFQTGDSRRVAAFWLREHFNHHLNERYAPTGGHRVDLERDDVAFQLFSRAGCLLDGLWLQFANAVKLGLRFRPCEVCGRYFPLVGRHADKKLYCSDACRAKAYRDRRADAASTNTE